MEEWIEDRQKEFNEYLKNKFNLPPLTEEKIKVTENRKKDYRYYYDESLFNKVDKIFKEDIEKYGYKF